MASSMAFFWAEEPSPFRVPLGAVRTSVVAGGAARAGRRRRSSCCRSRRPSARASRPGRRRTAGRARLDLHGVNLSTGRSGWESGAGCLRPTTVNGRQRGVTQRPAAGERTGERAGQTFGGRGAGPCGGCTVKRSRRSATGQSGAVRTGRCRAGRWRSTATTRAASPVPTRWATRTSPLAIALVGRARQRSASTGRRSGSSWRPGRAGGRSSAGQHRTVAAHRGRAAPLDAAARGAAAPRSGSAAYPSSDRPSRGAQRAPERRGIRAQGVGAAQRGRGRPAASRRRPPSTGAMPAARWPARRRPAGAAGRRPATSRAARAWACRTSASGQVVSVPCVVGPHERAQLVAVAGVVEPVVRRRRRRARRTSSISLLERRRRRRSTSAAQ